MNRIALLLIGLIVGVVGTWGYYTAVAVPRLITQIEVETKEQFEQSQMDKQLFVTATVTSISATTIEAMTEKDDREAPITINVSPTTKLSAQQNDDNASLTPITLSELAPGSVITVVTSGIIDLTQPIDALEIIKL